MIRPRKLAASASVVILLAAGCSASDQVSTLDSTRPAPVTTTTDAPLFVPDESDAVPTDTVPTDATTSTGPATTTSSTVPAATGVPSTITIPAPSIVTTTTSIAPPSTAATNTVPPNGLTIGTSVEGRPIIAEQYGTPGGRRVLVIGVIHGNEDGGVPIVDQLRRRALAGNAPEGVELWLIESMNPDGQAAQDRHNANQVDLNRNFPLRWGVIGVPGDGQYAGTGPASEPETQAMVAFISELRPDIAIWYHQDANLIIPSSGRDGRIRARYAELSGLPVADCCDGGVYTGIAATWARDELADQDGVAFIVELPGGDLPVEQVTVHADTVSTIAAEAGSL